MADSQVAFVTGAASGIGYTTAEALVRTGHSVAVVDVAGADDAAGRLNDAGSASGGRAIGIPTDVSDAEAVAAALSKTVDQFGVPTAVFTAAGIAHPAPLLDLSVEAWRRTVDVNLTGTFIVLQTAARLMLEAGLKGAMVAVASLSGRGPSPDNSDYAASKAGVISFVKSIAVTLAPHGIRVNSICPGVINTPFTDHMIDVRAAAAGVAPEQMIKTVIGNVPLGRWAEPSEVASVGLALLGDGFGYVTGQSVNVCGGLQFS